MRSVSSDTFPIMGAALPTIAMLGTFMALLLAIFLIVVPSRSRTANCLLALFLVTTAIDISGWFMDSWWRANPEFGNLRLALSAVQMPLFTGFIWFSCHQERRLHLRDSIHFLPGLVVLGMIATNTPMPWLRALFELQYAIYIGISIFVLWRFDQLLRERFVKRSASWLWLALLVGVSLIAHGFFIVRTVISPSLPVALSMALQTVAALLVLAITLWIAFQALLRPNLFRGGDQLLVSAANAMDKAPSNQNDKLAAFMDEQRPYLDPDLSLARLSRRSGIPTKELSALINQRHGSHFFDFINGYRIDFAKTLLLETGESVTDIIYASGFNAKSSFNTAFRKHTGTTPSAYRRENTER